MLEKREFTVDGKEYYVMRPTTDSYMNADKVRSKVFTQALQDGTLLRKQLDQELKSRKVWTSQMEAEYETLKKTIIDIEYTLTAGGISLSKAKDLALEAKDSRNRMVELLSSKTSLDSATCEGKADNAHFKALVAACTYGVDDKLVYNSYEDYLVAEDGLLAETAATEFYYLTSSARSSEDDLPEMKFLKKFKFVNDKNELVDKEGRRVDRDGRHLDENGNYIRWITDTEFVFVDMEGRELDENKDFKVEFSPFLDEDGSPIVMEEESKPAPVKKARVKKKEKQEPTVS